MDLKTRWTTNEDVVILAGGQISGDVTMGRGCSVWYNAVIRGDEAPITVGENTNIQDCAVLHTTEDHPMVVGSGVTVGHGAILHSCTVGDNSLIGMGAIVLDDALVGNNCIIGAGALVTKGTVVPDGSMFLGNPARLKRMLSPAEIEGNRENAEAYCKRRECYR